MWQLLLTAARFCRQIIAKILAAAKSSAVTVVACFQFLAVLAKKNLKDQIGKKSSQHHGAPKPLPKHLHRTPLTKPSGSIPVWMHMDA